MYQGNWLQRRSPCISRPLKGVPTLSWRRWPVDGLWSLWRQVTCRLWWRTARRVLSYRKTTGHVWDTASRRCLPIASYVVTWARLVGARLSKPLAWNVSWRRRSPLIGLPVGASTESGRTPVQDTVGEFVQPAFLRLCCRVLV